MYVYMCICLYTNTGQKALSNISFKKTKKKNSYLCFFPWSQVLSRFSLPFLQNTGSVYSALHVPCGCSSTTHHRDHCVLSVLGVLISMWHQSSVNNGNFLLFSSSCTSSYFCVFRETLYAMMAPLIFLLILKEKLLGIHS